MVDNAVLKMIDDYTSLKNLVSDVCESREFNQKVHGDFNTQNDTEF